MCVGWGHITRDIIDKRSRLPALSAFVSAGVGGTIFPSFPQLSQPSYPHSESAFLQTLKYLYDWCRCGIYVRIQNGSLVMFCPFVNPQFVNDWHDDLKWVVNNRECTMSEYLDAKQQLTGVREKIIHPKNWWANAHILCNVMPADIWGNFMVAEYKEFFMRLCTYSSLPDAEFFLNKRDFPQIRMDRARPFYFMYPSSGDSSNGSNRECVKQHLPILSSYVTDGNADVPFPTCADFDVAKKPPDVNVVSWVDKRNVALFRGSCTGCSGQRLQLAFISKSWAESPDPDRRGVLDAALTSWNNRDSVTAGGVVTFTHTRELKLGKFIPQQKQVVYKYLIYVDGHSAANRLSFLLASGCVTLKVDSVAHLPTSHLWFSKMLQPYVHYVPVASDYSDLHDQIIWCQQHDSECEAIALNAREFWNQWLSADALLDYGTHVLREVAKYSEF